MKSSFQELMELVAKDVESKDDASLIALLEKLIGLRESFKRDRDLLEAVIRRVRDYVAQSGWVDGHTSEASITAALDSSAGSPTKTYSLRMQAARKSSRVRMRRMSTPARANCERYSARPLVVNRMWPVAGSSMKHSRKSFSDSGESFASMSWVRLVMMSQVYARR